MIYADEYIEHWGNVYLANPVLAKHCILFETFLEAPEQLLAHYTLEREDAMRPADGGEFLQLLVPQRDVMMRVMLSDRDRRDPESIESYLMADKNCRISCGTYIEPLHHHTYKTSRQRHVGHA